MVDDGGLGFPLGLPGGSAGVGQGGEWLFGKGRDFVLGGLGGDGQA